MYFEQGFGEGKSLTAIEVKTEYGNVFLEGRIDRVDLLSCNDEERVKILDYKSGKEEFDKKAIENGFTLQLFVYLEAALQKDDRKPAGMFYFPIKEGQVSSSIDALNNANLSDDVKKELKKQYQLKGLAINTEEIIKAIDKNIFDNGNSPILNCKINKSGEINGKALISETDFKAFEDTIKKTIETLCINFLSGEISPKEEKLDKEKTSCTYCKYQGICLYSASQE